MSIAIDHIGLPAADPDASARFLADILGEGRTVPDGPDGEMINLGFGESTLTYFQYPAHEPHHIAFRVTPDVFTTAVTRLRELGVPFGNEPDSPSNQQTSDPLGGRARIYFRDPNGHLFELFVAALL
jgi:catechol 2,3-dioxygenase-like lactoylglutathione lyase family enzyme